MSASCVLSGLVLQKAQRRGEGRIRSAQEREGTCARAIKGGVREEGAFEPSPEGFVGLWQMDEARDADVDRLVGGSGQAVGSGEGGVGEAGT